MTGSVTPGWTLRSFLLDQIWMILGHKSLVTTQRYAHMSDKSLKMRWIGSGGESP